MLRYRQFVKESWYQFFKWTPSWVASKYILTGNHTKQHSTRTNLYTLTFTTYLQLSLTLLVLVCISFLWIRQKFRQISSRFTNPSKIYWFGFYIWTEIWCQLTTFHSLIIFLGKNFKTRINAATALSCLSERQNYGINFIPIICAIVSGLENMDDIEDFSEYKYKENLQTQVFSGLIVGRSVGELSSHFFTACSYITAPSEVEYWIRFGWAYQKLYIDR